jgi:hypothetical protein
LLTGENGTLGGVFSNFGGNNISADISRVLGAKKQATNPFVIGASRLGDGATLSKGVDYFIGSQRSDETGVFQSPYEIVVSGSSITALTIAFDTANNRHPNSVFIDGVENADDDSIFTIGNLASSAQHNITISNWNAPNYPLVITGIYVSVTIEVDRRSLISIDSTIFDRGDTKLPSYGIISNTGSIEFNDLNGEIRDYAEQQLLTSDLKVSIFLTNTLTKTRQQVADFETQEWDYDKDNRSVSVSLKDDLVEWQDISVEEISFDPSKNETKTFRWLYEHLWFLTSNRTYNGIQGNGNYNMLNFDELDEQTKDVLDNTYIKYPFLKSGSLWSSWEKLCVACQLHIYKNGRGIVVCRYIGGT